MDGCPLSIVMSFRRFVLLLPMTVSVPQFSKIMRVEEFSKRTVFVTRNFRVMYCGHTKLRKLHIFTFSLLYQIYRSACKLLVHFYVYLSAVAVLRRSLGETVHTGSRENENLLYLLSYWYYTVPVQTHLYILRVYSTVLEYKSAYRNLPV
jgi:hypothetical protein